MQAQQLDFESSRRRVNKYSSGNPSRIFTSVLESVAGRIRFHWNESERFVKIQLFCQSSEESFPDSQVPLKLRHIILNISEYLYSGTFLTFNPFEIIETSVITEFQRKVYDATCLIDHGETRTYGWVAERIKSPLASRAVGQALRSNLFPILIPCHRVISSSGALGGFMGKINPAFPELKLKERLLRLETSYVNPEFPFVG
jgi:O-6-methylguanine DNA methyltransferase